MSDINQLDAPSDAPVATTESRRTFLRHAVVTAVAMGSLASCSTAASSASELQHKKRERSHEEAHDARAAAQAPPPSPLATADAMDRMHEVKMKAFPAKTAGKGNQLLAPRLERGVKVFELTARPIKWEVTPGQMADAWAYNDQVPGPQIRVREGDRVRIVLHNELPESTSIHFHGLEIPNDQDGVTFITQPPVKPGASYTYEFTVPNSGSHMYHSHHNSAKQVGMGLLGAFIVEPKRARAIERAEVD
ncbi:MAG TPA: multicopper oxidase domain-containing protein, partial [Gemmatimonadaceae bacterium]|nr:multicopper oxidase domain-containing protein [Gemmatimonadaceae bacterium]